MKILVIDTESQYALGRLYYNAAISSGYDCDYKTDNDIFKINKFSKDNLLRFLEHSNYKIKWNQRFVDLVLKNNYDFVIFFRLSPIASTSILHLKILKNVKFILIWPDSILFFKNNLLDTLQNVDLIASYSEKDIAIFRSLKCENVKFIPLGYDPEIYKFEKLNKTYQISFLGLRQKYREEFIHEFSKKTDLNIFVSGPNWKNFKFKNLQISNKTYHSREASYVYNSSHISLNIVDPTNFPSANMRFFEINATNTIQLSSNIPEFSKIFVSQNGNLFFESINEAGVLANKYWNHNFNIENRHKNMFVGHTYKSRLSEILKHFK